MGEDRRRKWTSRGRIKWVASVWTFGSLPISLHIISPALPMATPRSCKVLVAGDTPSVQTQGKWRVPYQGHGNVKPQLTNTSCTEGKEMLGASQAPRRAGADSPG